MPSQPVQLYQGEEEETDNQICLMAVPYDLVLNGRPVPQWPSASLPSCDAGLHDLWACQMQHHITVQSLTHMCTMWKHWQIRSLESVARPVNAITVHCRINDIKRKDPKSASKSLVKSLRGIAKDHSKIKVLISKLPPVKDPNLQVKRDLFSALVFSELAEETDVSFVAYENLHQLSEGHHSSKKQGVVYPCKKSRQTYSQLILGNTEDSCQTCSSVTI